MLRYILLLVTALLLFSCTSNDVDRQIKLVLLSAGENRIELEKVLNYYTIEKPDKEKLDATRFLLANMKWHQSYIIKKQKTDLLDTLIYQADSILYAYFQSHPADSLRSKQLYGIILDHKNQFYEKIKNYSSPFYNTYKQYDSENISARQLIAQIEHAFEQRKRFSYLKTMPFGNFCEYVLPYQVIPDYPTGEMPYVYASIFNKYFENIIPDSLQSNAKRYNDVKYCLQSFFYHYLDKYYLGYKSFFLNYNEECVPVAYYGAAILRACGFPTTVELNSAYKQYQGKHFRTAIQRTDGKWERYNFGNNAHIMQNMEFDNVNNFMNVYRMMYSEQKNSPFFLKKKKEFVPKDLNSPFIKDVTSELIQTISLTLPFQVKSNNRLAYLATFNSAMPEGYVPVTWGKINKLTNRVTFDCVIPGRIYFPIYYTEIGVPTLFGHAFFLNESMELVKYPEEKEVNIYQIINLTRKFPRKAKLESNARKLIGTVIIASNYPDFSQCDTIGRIIDTPKPYFQDIVLNSENAPYQYYRIQTVDSIQDARIAEIQFITHKKYGYRNTRLASPLPILTKHDTIATCDVELIGLTKKEKYSYNPENDRNPFSILQIGKYDFKLPYPQYVTKFRFMPAHANNGIIPGDKYQLSYWDKTRWEIVGTVQAQYNYLEFKVLANRLYWLKNLSRGKEEMPFTIDKLGKQQFIYE